MIAAIANIIWACQVGLANATTLTCPRLEHFISHGRVHATLSLRHPRLLTSDNDIVPLTEIYRVKEVNCVVDELYGVNSWIAAQVDSL